MNSKVKNILTDLFTLFAKRDTKLLSLELGRFKEKELIKVLDVKQKELLKKESSSSSSSSSSSTNTTLSSEIETSSTKKTTNTHIKSKTSDKKDVTVSLKEEITRLTSTIETTKVSNLKTLFGTDVVTHSLVASKVLHFTTLYNQTKTEVDTRGEQLYNSFVSKNNGLSVINKDKPVITKEVFLKKMLGEEVNSPLDKRLVFELLNLYTQLKNVLHKPASKKSIEKVIKLDENTDDRKLLETIWDKEVELLEISFKKQTKSLNKFKDVLSEHVVTSINKLIQSVKDVVPVTVSVSDNSNSDETVVTDTDNSTKKVTHKNISLNMLFTKLMDTPSTFLNTQIHKFGHTFDFVLDRNVVSSVFVPSTGSSVKNIVEKDEVMSYLARKNNLNLIINKYLSINSQQLHLDSKIKSFLGYLLINMLYDDVLPLLSMAKEEEITYKKKIVDNDKKTYVEDKKKISFGIHKLHPVIVRNMLARV